MRRRDDWTKRRDNRARRRVWLAIGIASGILAVALLICAAIVSGADTE